MTDEGAELYTRIAPHEQEVVYDSIFVIGTVPHTLGRLARMLDKHDEAARYLHQAEELAQRLHAPLFVARTWADQAALATARGDTRRADALVDSALETAARHNAKGVEHYARTRALSTQADYRPRPSWS